MLVILLVIALFQYSTSSPLYTFNLRDQAQSTTPVAQHTLRTRFDIIWTCASTLFICTWVAIHPNIPPRDEGPIRSLWRRIKLMLWTLLVPELILIWAYKQWAAARYYGELFKEDGWTPTHGHFLIMGGFTLVRANEEEVLLDDDSFCKVLRMWPDSKPRFGEASEIVFPTMTAAEIHDKGRGDFLSKAIVVLQTTWFIMQCVARGIEGIALTELELVTLALASLNGLMYYFWWDKPLGVKEPIKVYTIDTDPPRKVVDGAERRKRYESSLETSRRSVVQRLLTPLHHLPSLIFNVPVNLNSMLSSSVALYVSILSSAPVTTCIEELNDLSHSPGFKFLWFLYLPMYAIGRPVVVLFESLVRIVRTESIAANASHVPTFYAPQPHSDESFFLFYIVLPIVAAIFGALHLIAWRFQFPSHVEQLLWRIGSLTITAIPSGTLAFTLFLLFIGICLGFLKEVVGIRPTTPSIPSRGNDSVEIILGVMVAFLGGAGLVAYMLARLLLLMQAVVLLRKQPDAAFYAINWTHFFPHL